MLIILTPFPLIIADKKYSIFYQKLKLRIVRRYVRQVGEWRGFLSPTDRQYIEQLGLNQLMWIYRFPYNRPLIFPLWLIILLPPLLFILILSPGKRYSAYLCTTLSTVVAMVASFLGSQHTFCFLQVPLIFTIINPDCGYDENHGGFDKDNDNDGHLLSNAAPSRGGLRPKDRRRSWWWRWREGRQGGAKPQGGTPYHSYGSQMNEQIVRNM